MRHRSPIAALALFAALLFATAPLEAQGVRDSALVRVVKQNLDSIARDKGAPAYSKRAQLRIRAAADSFLTRVVVQPAPTPSPAPAPVPTPSPDTVVIVTQPPSPLPPPVVVDTSPPPIAVPAGVSLATLPRTRVDTRYPTAAFRALTVAGNVQAALDSARCGDVVLLPAGARYVGNFTLPAKTCVGPNPWIIVRTNASLMADGQRIDSLMARQINYAQLVTPNNVPALTTVAGSNHYRLVGVELGLASPTQTAFTNGLLALVEGSSDIIADRVYIHGSPTGSVHRCIVLQNARSAVIDSDVSTCYGPDGDSQAIVGWNGPGPYEIRNNRLSGGHEVVMFGGADPVDKTLSPSDIWIEGNLIERSIAEMTPKRGITKTLLELKNARFVAMIRNTFRNQAGDAQDGFGFNWKSTNQQGGCPLCRVSDVTFRRNHVVNVASGFKIAAAPQGPTTYPTSRITIAENIIEIPSSVAPWTADPPIPLQILGPVNDVVIANNTFKGRADTWGFLMLDGVNQRLVVQDNVLPCVGYGVKGTGLGGGMATITPNAPGSVWARNAIVGCELMQYPPTWPAAQTFVKAGAPLPAGVGADPSLVAP